MRGLLLVAQSIVDSYAKTRYIERIDPHKRALQFEAVGGPMTEMVYGSIPQREGEPVLPRWWRTIDRWSLAAVFMLFGIGLLLGLAASPPLAQKNNLADFHYVQRQAFFGSVALMVMVLMSMMDPQKVRRLGVLGFAAAFIALVLLPFFGTDFGKGATRWFSLGFASVQPSEFLKPAFVITAAWLMAAANEIGGPPGRLYSFMLVSTIVVLLAFQPDFGQASLVMFSWCVMYFVAGAPMVLLLGLAGGIVLFGTVAYNNSEHFARRIDGFLNPDIDPTTQIGYATNAIREGGFFGVGVGEGTVKWSLPRCAYRFHHCRGRRRIRADPRARDPWPLCHHHRPGALAFVARTRPVYPPCGDGACLCLRGSGLYQHGCGGTLVARQGHDPAVCVLWRLVGDCLGYCPRGALGVYAHPPPRRDR